MEKYLFKLALDRLPDKVTFDDNSEICIVVLLFYIHGKHLRSCRDGQLT